MLYLALSQKKTLFFTIIAAPGTTLGMESIHNLFIKITLSHPLQSYHQSTSNEGRSSSSLDTADRELTS